MLAKILSLRSKSIVSLVGAGGKTTFINSLAQELKCDNKVLVTTSTKMYLPKAYDFLAIGKSFNSNSKNGLYVYGDRISQDGKLSGVAKAYHDFDYVLIEADGAKGKDIKGWDCYEPVIVKETTMTVGIISIEAVGKLVNKQNVHRSEKFINLTNTRENALITVEDIGIIITHPEGLFKKAQGEKVLFINKVEANTQVISALKIIKFLRHNNTFFDKVIIGSLKKMQYKLINLGDINGSSGNYGIWK